MRLLRTGLLLVLSACDPFSDMTASIENGTAQSIEVTLVSQDSALAQSFALPSRAVAVFQEGGSTTGSFLEPSLVGYDSVVVTSVVGEVLRVYRPGEGGRTIFDIPGSWELTEGPERFYRYVYRVSEAELR